MESAKKSAFQGTSNEGKSGGRRKSYILYTAWSPLIRTLPDEAAGKLFKAVCDFQDGIPVTLEDQTLKAIFALFVAAFSGNAEKYERVCARNAVNGKKGGRPKKARASPQEEEKDTGIKDQAADAISSATLSEPVREKLREWVAYKKEQRKPYKPTGLKSLITRVEQAEKENGAAAVIEVIDNSMACGYAGILWDKLKKTDQVHTRPGPQIKNMFNDFEQNQYDYDALERELIGE